MNTYSNPSDKTLTVATSPLLPDLFSDGYHLPSVPEILLRLVHGWMVVRPQTLKAFSHYGQRTMEEFLPILVNHGLIKPLGRVVHGLHHGVADELYTVGAEEPDRSLYSFKPRFRCEAWDPKALPQDRGVITTQDLIVPTHQFFVVETAAWLGEELARFNTPYFLVPEQVLRGEYGWHTDKTQRQKKTYFLTPVPDAWVIFGCYSFRLEVQLSEISTEKVRHICENSPLKEPVLYVVPDDDDDMLYKRLVPLLNEVPNFFLVRFRNAQDLSKVWPRFQALAKRGGFRPWWMRDHYAGKYFAHATMKAEAATLFADTYITATEQLKKVVSSQK